MRHRRPRGPMKHEKSGWAEASKPKHWGDNASVRSHSFSTMFSTLICTPIPAASTLADGMGEARVGGCRPLQCHIFWGCETEFLT